MLNGTAYGVVLNDRAEREALAGSFAADPYKNPPRAPVLYIKPRTCAVPSGSVIEVPEGEVRVAATLALQFVRSVSRTTPREALQSVGGMCLALDLSELQTSYYRPAIREMSRDGFLPLGETLPFEPGVSNALITTFVDGEEVHSWSLARLVRPIEELIADISEFMTFEAGDLLLVGLAGDAPRARAGQAVSAGCSHQLPPIHVTLEAEPAP